MPESDEYTAVVDELQLILAADGELSDEQLARGEELVAKGRELSAAKTAADERAARDAALREAVTETLTLRSNGKSHEPTPGTALLPWQAPAPPVPRKTAADLFLESKSYKTLLSEYPHGLPDSMRIGSLAPVHIGGMKAVLTSGEAAGLTTAPDRVAMPMFPWGYPLTLRDVITTGTTASDTVEFAQVLAMSSAAAPTAEATETAGSGTKPESSLTFQKVTAPVRTIAHWLAATKRSLSDAGQLRTLIESFLRFGLEKEVEDQIVNGLGTGEDFRGILNTTGTLAVPFATDVPTTIRKAITAVTVTGLVIPNAVLMNPADAEGLDLLKDSTNRYLGNGPFGIGPTTIWGLPRVVTPVLAAGTAIVGDFRQAVLWDRETATLTATDSHADFFIRNLVAILAELRAAFGIFRPAAFGIADLTV